MKRSLELKQGLVNSVDIAITRKEQGIVWQTSGERRKVVQSELAALRNETQVLMDDLEHTTDEQFEQKVQEIRRRLERLEAEERSIRAEYTIPFVDIASIENLREFIRDKCPMQFIPHKEEIGRLLAVAKSMHDARVRRGDAQKSEPIRIVDVGGSNGALGKLIANLARENNLNIHIVVVDPDTETVGIAAESYREDTSLQFIQKTAGEYCCDLYKEDPELQGLIQFRAERVREGNRILEDLGAYIRTMYETYLIRDPEERRKLFEKYCRVFREDFGIDLPQDLEPTMDELIDFFEDEEIFGEGRHKYEIIESIPYTHKYRDRVLRPEIDRLTRQIKEKLAVYPSTVDLVINAWMPPGVDFTTDVQLINGEAIVYALERYGATGCQSNVPFPEKPERLGEGESYHTGVKYTSVAAWVSHASVQLERMDRLRPRDVPFTRRLLEYVEPLRNEENVYPHANGFVVQLNKALDASVDLCIDPERAGIAIVGTYPWERELDERGGGIMPIHQIHDENGVPAMGELMRRYRLGSG